MIDPAGEMWSVVTESPKMPSTRALLMLVGGFGFIENPSKNGGFAMYVDFGQL